MVLIFALNAHLSHWERCQKRSDVRPDRPIESRDDNCVADFEDAIHKNNINCRAVALDDLHFKHRALKDILLFQAVTLCSLAHVAEVVDQVRESLTCDGRSRYKTQCVVRRVVVPVECDVETLLVKGENSLCQLRLEVILRVLFLLVQRVPRVLILLDSPAIQPVNLVQRDAERRVLLL